MEYWQKTLTQTHLKHAAVLPFAVADSGLKLRQLYFSPMFIVNTGKPTWYYLE